MSCHEREGVACGLAEPELGSAKTDHGYSEGVTFLLCHSPWFSQSSSTTD